MREESDLHDHSLTVDPVPAAPEAEPYVPPAITWREKFATRDVIGASNIQGQPLCGF